MKSPLTKSLRKQTPINKKAIAPAAGWLVPAKKLYFTQMKKMLFVAICFLGISCFSSCRSTSSSCGLAENQTENYSKIPQNYQL